MGFLYLGPVDGHDLEVLVPLLEAIRDDNAQGPVLLHIRTQKGYGYKPAEGSADRLHAVAKFDVASRGRRSRDQPKAPSYTRVFADALIAGGGGRSRRSSPSPPPCLRARALDRVPARLFRIAPSTSASPSNTR